MKLNDIFYPRFTVGQIQNIYKNQKRQVGKYLALWCESGHLKNKFMVTLSPFKNTIENTILLRNEFMKKLNNIVHYQKAELAYFSAIESKVNEIPLNEETAKFEEERMSNDDINWHVHIQLLTTLSEDDVQKALERIDCSLCSYKHLTPPKEDEEDREYEYVIKDIKDIDFKAEYYVKKFGNKKTRFTSSRKEIADYLVRRLWEYMKFMYPKNWSKIDNKYAFILDLKKSNDILFGKVKDNHSVPNGYDRIIVKEKTIDIKKRLFSKSTP